MTAAYALFGLLPVRQRFTELQGSSTTDTMTKEQVKPLQCSLCIHTECACYSVYFIASHRHCAVTAGEGTVTGSFC